MGPAQLSAAHLEHEGDLRRQEHGDLAAGAEDQVRRQLARLLLDQHDGDERLAGACLACTAQLSIRNLTSADLGIAQLMLQNPFLDKDQTLQLRSGCDGR